MRSSPPKIAKTKPLSALIGNTELTDLQLLTLSCNLLNKFQELQKANTSLSGLKLTDISVNPETMDVSMDMFIPKSDSDPLATMWVSPEGDRGGKSDVFKAGLILRHIFGDPTTTELMGLYVEEGESKAFSSMLADLRGTNPSRLGMGTQYVAPHRIEYLLQKHLGAEEFKNLTICLNRLTRVTPGERIDFDQAIKVLDACREKALVSREHSWVKNYEKIWAKEKGSDVNKALAILSDYTGGGKKSKLIATGHWNRSNLELINKIVADFKKNPPTDVKAIFERIKKDLAETNTNLTGSLYRRLKFIASSTHQTFELPKPVEEKEVKKV